jgi:hypothetical protein
MMIEVIELTRDDIHWPFDEPPYIKTLGGRWGRREKVDPFPCYTHDVSRVRELAARVHELWPVPLRVLIHVIPFESLGRTNGWASVECDDYSADPDKKTFTATIVFSGKRIPIHPSLTEYLVAQEYSHVIEDAIALSRGGKIGTREILPEYEAARGLTDCHDYGGMKWHAHSGEVFACDCRILMFGIQRDFWPHPGIKRPEECGTIVDWWQTERAKMEAARLAKLENNREE